MMRIQYPNLLTTWCQRSNPTITWFRIMAFLENIWWGPIFGPVQNLDIVTWCICTPFHFWSTRILFEINDHEIEFRFWSTFKLIENPLLVNFEQMKVDQKTDFEEFMITGLINGSKIRYWFTFICSKLDQKRNSITWSFILKRNSGGPKVRRFAFASHDYILQILNWIKKSGGQCTMKNLGHILGLKH